MKKLILLIAATLSLGFAACAPVPMRAVGYAPAQNCYIDTYGRRVCAVQAPVYAPAPYYAAPRAYYGRRVYGRPVYGRPVYGHRHSSPRVYRSHRYR